MLEAAIRPETRLVLAEPAEQPDGQDDVGRRMFAGPGGDLCRRHGLWLLNDEVYRHIDRDPALAACRCVADAYERGVSIDGVSKGYGLPGLRVGWIACAAMPRC